MSSIMKELVDEGKALGKIEGKAEGKAEGKTEGKLDILSTMINSGKLTEAEAAEMAGLSLKDFEIALAEYRKVSAM